jgi:hypothetical protein
MLKVSPQPQYGPLKVTTAQPQLQQRQPLKVQPLSPQPTLSVKPLTPQSKLSVAQPQVQKELPVTVNLPDGRSATFPSAQAAAAFKAQVGINDTPAVQPEQEKTNLAQDAGRALAKPLVWAGDRIGRVIGYGAAALTGNEQAKERALSGTIRTDLPGLGSFDTQAPQTVKQEIGNAAQVVALGVGNPAAGGLVYGLGEGLANNDSLAKTAFKGVAYGAGGKLTEIGVNRVAAPLIAGAVNKLKPAASKAASLIPQAVKQEASQLVSKINQAGEKFTAPYNRVIENTQLMGKANREFVSSVAQNVRALADIPDRAMQSFSRRLEQASLRMTPTEKRALGSRLKETVDFLSEKKIVGTPQMRYDKVTEIYNDAESTLQTFLTKDAKDRFVNKQALLETVENLKGKFQSHRDALAIENQLDDFKKLLESKYEDAIPVDRLNQLKRSTFESAYNKAGSKVLDDVEFAIGDTLKESIEAATDGLKINGQSIGQFNKEYGKVITARKLLNVAKDRNQLGAIGRLLLGGFGGASALPLTGGFGSAAVGYAAQAGANELATPVRSLAGAGLRQLAKKNPTRFTGIKPPEVNVGLSIKNVAPKEALEETFWQLKKQRKNLKDRGLGDNHPSIKNIDRSLQSISRQLFKLR